MTSQNPGIFRDFAESRNIAFHEIDLHAGESIPELNDFDGLWVMGGLYECLGGRSISLAY